MKIIVDANDIFRYVVGNTTVDPIEALIDFENQYEVFEEIIYDHRGKRFLPQPETFKIFSKAISQLRANSSSMKREDILNQCSELAKFNIDVDLGNG